MTVNYPQEVIRVTEIFKKHGHSAYAVGGCIRDVIMGRIPDDWDMTTDASPDKMIEIFRSEGIGTVPTGLKHGTVTLLIGDMQIECTTFRIDGSYTDSRHPDSVTFTPDVKEDLARRDFTMNAMAGDPLSPTSDGIIDIFGGMSDIDSRILRSVGDPLRRFSEDALRILRAVRFATTLDLHIDPYTESAAKQLADGLVGVSIERKVTELRKILLSDRADRGVSMLIDMGLSKYIHSEIKTPSIPLSRLPMHFPVRMAAILGEGDHSISHLKLSNEESSQIKLLCNSSEFCGEVSEKNARRLIFSYRSLAPDATLLYGSRELFDTVTEQMSLSPCTKISDLKINGNDVISLGIEKRKIGEVLSSLLSLVVDDQSLNDRDTLISLAEKMINK